MNITRRYILTGFALLVFLVGLTHAQTRTQLATAAKLGLVHSGFKALSLWISDDYLWNWQRARGTAKVFPVSSMTEDVSLHLSKQRQDIIKQVERGVKSGSYKQNSKVRILARNSDMPRPGGVSDFAYAIGGCTITSYADVAIGRADSKGSVGCKITTWASTLSDRYKFDYSDKFDLAGYAVFEKGELYNFERAGLAREYPVSSKTFFSQSVMGPFVVNK